MTEEATQDLRRAVVLLGLAEDIISSAQRVVARTATCADVEAITVRLIGCEALLKGAHCAAIELAEADQ